MAHMAKKLIIANWKMNPETVGDAVALAKMARAAERAVRGVALVVCPPAIFLSDIAREFKKNPPASRLTLGAQNCSWEKSGPFTGETSPSMLRAKNARWVILGHSERRALGESDALIQKKATSALKAGLSVVLCVGEETRDEHGEYLPVLEAQLKKTLPDLPRKFLDRVVIAYEPLWAISTHATGAATPEEVFSMAIFIRKVLTEAVGKDFAMKVPILYGGSADALNAAPMITHGGVQGLLVGRESLNPKSFPALLDAVAKAK